MCSTGSVSARYVKVPPEATKLKDGPTARNRGRRATAPTDVQGWTQVWPDAHADRSMRSAKVSTLLLEITLAATSSTSHVSHAAKVRSGIRGHRPIQPPSTVRIAPCT